MQLLRRTPACSRAVAPQRQATAVTRPMLHIAKAGLQDPLPVDPTAVVGERLGKWLPTIYDALVFPARAGAGALVSAPERLQTLQTDVQRLVDLAQDPRPVEEKQTVLRQELEDTVLSFLEKGVTVEQDVLANLKTVLPPEAAQVLSELIPEPPSAAKPYDGVSPDGTVTTAVDASGMTTVEVTTYGQQDVLAAQVESEIREIRGAVAGLKGALDGMRTNTDASSAAMLRLTLRESRDQLARRLAEVSPATATDPSVAAATREAGILLEEVDAMFYAS